MATERQIEYIESLLAGHGLDRDSVPPDWRYYEDLSHREVSRFLSWLTDGESDRRDRHGAVPLLWKAVREVIDERDALAHRVEELEELEEQLETERRAARQLFIRIDAEIAARYPPP